MLVKNGKILGVLGGMGPAASAEFLRQLAAFCPASCDQEHPIVYMIADCDIPDRTAAIFGQGPSPLPRLQADLERLAALGADLLAVPCNTAHYFIDQFLEQLPIPFIHIVEETVLATQRLSPAGAWLLSTKGTRACGLYQACAAKHGLTLYIPDEGQSDKAQLVIDRIKANDFQQAGQVCRDLVTSLWRERDIPVMTACTELPLGYAASGLPQERAVSSITALARACVRELYREE